MPAKETSVHGRLEMEFAVHNEKQRGMNKLEDRAFHPVPPDPEMEEVIWRDILADLQFQNFHK